MKKLFSILLSVVMLTSITAELDLTALAVTKGSSTYTNFQVTKQLKSQKSTGTEYYKNNGTDNNVLLIQTSSPWETTTNIDVLTSFVDSAKIDSYSQVSMADAANSDFTEYNLVVLANDQAYSSYKEYEKIKNSLEKYVYSGGMVIFGACDDGWAKGSFDVVLPGGVTKYKDNSEYNYIASYANSFVTGSMTDSESLTDNMLYAKYCSHTSFNEDTFPEETEIILRSSNTNSPTLAVYSYGDGEVIASGNTWEFAYEYSYDNGYGDYYDDLILYAISESNKINENDNSGYIVDSGFKIGENNNSFSNALVEDGFAGVKNYEIDASFYNSLFSNCEPGEISDIKEFLDEEWGGACYGIATTMGMLYQGYIGISDLSSFFSLPFNNNYIINKYYNLVSPNLDKKLLNTIHYFHVSQILNKGGELYSAISYTVNDTKIENQEYNYDNLKTFLKKLVERASSGETTLFSFSNAESGHSVLITGCSYDEYDKEYKVKIYDENSAGGGSEGEFTELTVSKDFRNFNWLDANLNNDTYVQMSIADWSKMKQLDGSVNGTPIFEQVNDTKTVVFLNASLNDTFKITNDNGEYFEFDGTDFSGDMNVYSFETEENAGEEDAPRVKIAVDPSDNYYVTDNMETLDIEVSNSDDFMSIKTDNVTETTLSFENGITITGENYNFVSFMDTDEIVADNENNLISIAGTANNKTTIKCDGNNVIAENEDGISNAELSNYIGVESATLTLTDSTDKIEVGNIYQNHTHEYNSGEITKEATCLENGIKTYYCIICGYEYTETISALGHSFGNNGKTCSVCGEANPNYIGSSVSTDTNIITSPADILEENTSHTTAAKSAEKPKSTKITKLKKGKKSATVQWKKVSGVGGYQIQAATDKKFKKGKKSVTVKKSKTTKTTIKKLKSNMKYYVRIRTYKTVNGKKVYSKWSKVKTVKTK